MLVRAKSIHPLLVLAGLMAVSLAGLALLPKIPQDQAYHLFADQRTLFGIPNFWNVVSNIPFIVVGAAGLARFRDDAARIVLFLGFFLTGIGSAYYHWDPNDGTLFWDRLPMTISFAAILSLVVQERVGARMGRSCFGRCSQSGLPAYWHGCGPTICVSISGRNSFRAWR